MGLKNLIALSVGGTGAAKLSANREDVTECVAIGAALAAWVVPSFGWNANGTLKGATAGSLGCDGTAIRLSAVFGDNGAIVAIALTWNNAGFGGASDVVVVVVGTTSTKGEETMCPLVVMSDFASVPVTDASTDGKTLVRLLSSGCAILWASGAKGACDAGDGTNCVDAET